MKDALGDKIRELRKQKGLTQRQLAEAVEIDFTYLSKIENGKLPYTPSAGTLKRLSVELEADELELLRLAEKLPVDMQKIAQSEHALNFLRRASGIKSPQEWEDLFAFLDKKEQQRNSGKGSRKSRKG
ncbi:MAG: helix-turn-helix transcriptional regulator [Acidobacteria bacterium]|nr:helix-turn-helix transcriptional regulator [Acidobacteriota bacterium]